MTERARRWTWLVGCLLIGFSAGIAITRTGTVARRPQTAAVAPLDVLEVAPSPASTPAQPAVADSSEVGASESKSPVKRLQEALTIVDVLNRRHSLETLGVEWAKADLDSAFGALSDLRNFADRSALIRGIFHSLSEGDPRATLSAVLRLEGASDRLAARKELLAAWLPRFAPDSKLTENMIDFYGSGALGIQLLSTSPPQDELAVMWANSLGPGEGKARMLGEIAGSYAFRKSPEEGLRLGEALSGEDYIRFLTQFAGGYARKDGAAAFSWSMQFDDPVLRASIQQEINSQWVIFDTDGATAYFESMDPGPARDSLLREIASTLSSRDSSEALTWIRGLASATDQSAARQIVESLTPVGIGVHLSMSGGLPMIQALLPGASADLSQQVQPGDRIVAVDQYGNGQFVGVQGMDLDKVVNLIRGEAGTSLRLQVSRVSGKGFGQPRVVVLPRTQLVHQLSD